ncbi:hypothetical protein Efla_007851 [Eimeria flavescens]
MEEMEHTSTIHPPLQSAVAPTSVATLGIRNKLSDKRKESRDVEEKQLPKKRKRLQEYGWKEEAPTAKTPPFPPAIDTGPNAVAIRGGEHVTPSDSGRVDEAAGGLEEEAKQLRKRRISK